MFHRTENVLFFNRVSYEFASPVIQYEFECFRKTDSVFFFGVSQKSPKYSVFIFFACYILYRTQMLPD